MTAALALAAPLQAPATLSPLPARLGTRRLQGLLQAFVDSRYRKAFRHLGDERDFDHGHMLFASADDPAPVAILYHTQELAYYAKADSGYGWLDPEGRNWIQWLKDGRIENARRYLNAVPQALPLDPAALKTHHTILAEMLDPSAFGSRRLRSRQVVFTKASCAAPAGERLRIRVPRSGTVCLRLSEY